MGRWTYYSAAGLLAAAIAVAAAELAAGLLGTSSLIVLVGNLVVDNTPGPIVKWAIDAFGTNDKPILLGSVTAIALALGAALGPLAARSRQVATAAFVLFGGLGWFAGQVDPLTSGAAAFLVGAAAVAAGLGALHVLLGAVPAEGGPAVVMPGRGVADRRRFLAFAGAATGGAAVAAVTGRLLLDGRVDIEEQRASIVLPTVERDAAANVGLEHPQLSPLVTPNEDFYRIDTALVVPRVEVADWRLRIHGMVDEPYELTFDELSAMATIEESATLACVSNEVGGGLVGNAVWLGVPLRGILERAGVQAGATQIVGRSVDGFTVGFPTEIALDGRSSMVAIGMNGEPLPAAHGFPARLVVPGLYGYVSATKWLSDIELTRLEDFDAYWIPRGWAKEAPIKTQSRIDVPRASAVLAPGPTAVAGVAWAGARSVDRVEVRIRRRDEPDDAGEWREARLSEELNESSWRQWLLEWDATPGDWVMAVRSTDGTGEPQTAEERPPAPDGATGHHTIRVTVRG